MRFTADPSKSLVCGEDMTEVQRVVNTSYKKGMIFVEQERRLYRGSGSDLNEDGWGVIENRTHVFREPDHALKTGAKDPVAMPQTQYRFDYTPSQLLLFRYSALTFNGHRIHYDRQWAREKEGHKDLVVHGPLTATLLIQLAERVADDRGQKLVGFTYRATSPMYVDRPVALLAEPTAEGAELLAFQEGRQGMKASAVYSDA